MAAAVVMARALSASAQPVQPRVVVIVGAGMAGLTCARELLRTTEYRVRLVEAASKPGGRVRATALTEGSRVPLDLGAEFVHGTGTVLTELIHELFVASAGTRKRVSAEDLYEPVFVTSHADGGPDDAPTVHGKYGMFFVDGRLIMYNDPAIQQVSAALADVLDESSAALSLGEALDGAPVPLPPSLRAVAVASFANTSGCSDLYGLSLPMLRKFKRHWDEHETAGDFRLSIGMTAVVDAMVDNLQQEGRDRCSLQCNWKVQRIRQHGDQIFGAVDIESATGEMIRADAVVVTVPPPLLKQLDMELPEKKVSALSNIGFARVVKVILQFSTRAWPEKLQSIICADELPVPEIWFFEVNDEAATRYVAVGYLTSDAADSFVRTVKESAIAEATQTATRASADAAAGKIFLQQLARVLSQSEASLSSSLLGSLVYDWKDDHPTVQGGYMYPMTGLTVQSLQDLAAPHGRVVFAGEATNTNACCTLQAAMETGIRAADQVRRLC